MIADEVTVSGISQSSPQTTLDNRSAREPEIKAPSTVRPEWQATQHSTHPLVSSNTKTKTRSYYSPLEEDLEAQGLPLELNSNYGHDLDFATVLAASAPQRPPDYTTAMSMSGQVLPSIVDPFAQGSVVSGTFSAQPTLSSPQSFTSTQQNRTANSNQPSLMNALASSKSGVLPASPRRFPLNTMGDVSTKQTPKVASVISILEDQNPGLRTVPEYELREKRDGTASASISERAARRAVENASGVLPFFEWHTQNRGTAGTIPEKPSRNAPKPESATENVMPVKQQAVTATAILSDIDTSIAAGKYYDVLNFHVRSEDYDKIGVRREDEVVALLQGEIDSNDVSGPEDNFGQVQAREFLETKVQLFLGIHGLLSCFVYHNRHEAKVIGKIWGIVYAICKLQDTAKVS